ncbi:MAG: HesA/MoeB/ThiF family protein [Nanoarchaeota archaeon]
MNGQKFKEKIKFCLKAEEKYSRQSILAEIGAKGQEKLARAKVTIVGIGGLGTNAAELLARAGAGHLKLIDGDVIKQSNLPRQTLFTEKDINKNKAKTALGKLAEINSLVKIEAEDTFLDEKNVYLLNDADLVMDCTDNMKTRFLINKFCLAKNKPWIYAACVKTSGYVMPFTQKKPCLNCFIKGNFEPAESACTLGVLNTLPAFIAALQATLTIKIIVSGNVQTALYYCNLWTQEFRKIKIKSNSKCRLCN